MLRISKRNIGNIFDYKYREIVQSFAKRRNGFRHFGEVNYSYPRLVVYCVKAASMGPD